MEVGWTESWFSRICLGRRLVSSGLKPSRGGVSGVQGNGWIRSNPLKHNEYVNQTRDQIPEAKRFIRLIKEWKYQRRVPVSSLYLEMRAAKYLRQHKPYLVLGHGRVLR